MKQRKFCFLLACTIFCLTPLAHAADASDAGLSSETIVNDQKSNGGGTGSMSGESAAVDTGNVKPDELLDFARTLLGVPYRYASADPNQGFDCSGYVNYVFQHFGIRVPRISRDFAVIGGSVPLEEALPGDLILFTGTDLTKREVGHLGIVEGYDDGVLNFLHSSSGNKRGVVRTSMQSHYVDRFIKVIRVFAG